MKMRAAIFALALGGIATLAAATATRYLPSPSLEFQPAWPLLEAGSVPPETAAEPDAISPIVDTPEDYLIQMVCVDSADVATSQDPYTCPKSRRKLRVGERLPYHKYDGPPSTVTQISDSFPVGDIQGRLRVVHSFFFTRYSHVPLFDGAAALRRNASYDLAAETGTTGYDLSMADGQYVSFMATYDGGRGWQPFWTNGSCGQADNWIIAPRSAVVPFGPGSAVSNLAIAYPQCPSVDSFGQVLTVWDSYSNVTFEGGQTTSAIKSWHFAGNSLDGSGFEVFYFTKEYGKTRWEAWARSTEHPFPSATAMSRCPSNVGNGYVTFGATTYTLQDCHDWSFIVPAQAGGWDPSLNWHVDPLFNSINLLKNTHLQCTSGSLTRDCTPGGGTGSCTNLTHWSTLGPVTIGVDETLMGRDDLPGLPPRASANCAMTAFSNAAFSGQSVYQDVTSIPPGHSRFSFGAAIWRPELSNFVAAQSAQIVVFEVNAAGVVAQHVIPVSVERKRVIAKGEFTINPSTTWLRFQIYFDTAGIHYEFSDAWIAPAV